MYVPHGCSKKLIIFSGAGLSAESGISTFRDSNGLWENHKIDEVCNQFTWKNNFDLVHKFYNQRRVQLKDVEPNEAHKTIARLQEKYGNDCFVITQNVDDLLERAGVKNLMHVHGDLTRMHCEACGEKWSIGYEAWDHENGECPKCKSKKGVRPDIVFFGGVAPMYSYMHRAFENLMDKDSILVVIGTMGNVVPIAAIIGKISNRTLKNEKSVRAKTILNNFEESEYLPAELFDHVFYDKATCALPQIEKIIEDLWVS